MTNYHLDGHYETNCYSLRLFPFYLDDEFRLSVASVVAVAAAVAVESIWQCVTVQVNTIQCHSCSLWMLWLWLGIYIVVSLLVFVVECRSYADTVVGSDVFQYRI